MDPARASGPPPRWHPWPVEPPRRCTARLRLRPMDTADADDLFAVYGDPEVMRHASDPPFATPEVVWRMLSSVAALHADGTSIEWAVVERDGGRLVGTCGLHGFDVARREAAVGCLLRRDRWGRGLMREALQALVAVARDELGLASLVAEIDADNVRSRALFARLGFVPGDDGRHRRGLLGPAGDPTGVGPRPAPHRVGPPGA